MIRAVYPLTAFALAGLLLVAGCSEKNDSPPPPTLSTEPVRKTDQDHGHKPGRHGGLIVSIGSDSYHAEAVFEKGGRLRLYMLGKDETRHASLAHEVSSWARRRLSKRARARLDAARDRAFRELAEQSSEPIAEAASLGLPSPENARAPLSAMRVGIG